MDMRKPMVNFMLVGITRSRDDVFIGKVQGYLEAHLTLNGLKKYIDDGKVPGNPDILYLVTGMGAHHDTFPECPWEAGYLMSYVDGGLKRYRPSPCSVKAMQEVYRACAVKRCVRGTISRPIRRVVLCAPTWDIRRIKGREATSGYGQPTSTA
ncbi:hypothetical protein HPB50_020652 [Hyalomma asiaticum]|uniref:Uncharacterized protein n=1 Tax=Hyalomma asiaticum TaxID=266040 RepID=A0ACB7RQG0_HYAAI|nr:hypothetical protein HPB50_020652 [Hyalomma asiaticum]